MDSTKPLNLKIEWKGVLKKGQELSPNFVITGENLHALKSVTCKLDERIESPYWKKNPQEPQDIVHQGNSWSFVEPLSLVSIKADGNYYIRFIAIFLIRQGLNIVRCRFQTTIWLKVVTSDEKKERTITIEAGDGAVVMVEDNDSADIHVVAGKDSVVDISPSFVERLLQPQKPVEDGEQVVQTIEGEGNNQPAHATVSNPILFLRATFSDGQERFFQIAARQSILLGRGRDESAEENKNASDFVYRFYGFEEDPDPVSVFLTQYISRNHLRMSLHGNGLELENSGANISFSQNGQEKNILKNKSLLVEWDDLGDRNCLKFGGFSSIELKKFGTPPEWDANGEIIPPQWDLDIIQTLQNQVFFQNEPGNTLWNLGTYLKVNSLRLRHCEDFDSCTLRCKKDKIQEEKYARQFPDASLESPCWKKDPMASKDECHLLLRMLTIGNNPITDAICFERQGMQERHATLYFCENRFGLINHSTTAIVYRQYGHEDQLFLDECLSLEPGMTFKIGNVDFHVFESYSSYLNVQRQNQQSKNGNQAAR